MFYLITSNNLFYYSSARVYTVSHPRENSNFLTNLISKLRHAGEKRAKREWVFLKRTKTCKRIRRGEGGGGVGVDQKIPS